MSDLLVLTWMNEDGGIISAMTWMRQVDAEDYLKFEEAGEVSYWGGEGD